MGEFAFSVYVFCVGFCCCYDVVDGVFVLFGCDFEFGLDVFGCFASDE